MKKLLQDILDIQKNNRFLTYIANRITQDDYRGVHRSQHNRYDLDKVKDILKAIHKVSGKGNFSVPKGDFGGSRKKLKMMKKMKNQHPKFDAIFQILKSKKIISKPDPLRKNFFVEFSRMGFLTKYDKNGNKLDPFRRTYTETIKLSEAGIRFLGATTLFEKHKIFTEGVERLLKDTLVDLVSAIDLSDYRRDSFSFEEYTLIFSDNKIDGTEKIEMLDAWRKLTRNQQDKALKLIQEYCNPERFSGDKTHKRDYHNWRNETQQLMALFKMTVYFEVHGNQFKLNTGNEFGIFNKTRKGKPKIIYFEEHKIDKKRNYELHHIIPLSYVRNQKEYDLIDNFKNLIYLHKNKHREIKRDYIMFTSRDPKVHFGNRFDPSDKVTAKRGVNANYNPSLLNAIEKHNAKLIRSFLDSNEN